RTRTIIVTENRKITDEFHVSFLETWDVSYVADSALITEENVRLMDAKKVRFISRLPGRFNLEQELIERAWKEGKWRSCGPMVKGKKAATYWTEPFPDNRTPFRVLYSLFLKFA